MKSLRKTFIALGAAGALTCCALLALLAWPAAGWKATSIPTGSMAPNIKPGSLVLVHSVPASSLKVGDVITYANPHNMKQTITHRVIKTGMLSGKVPILTTKGDANPAPDIPIVGGMVKGRVETITPYLGTAVSWLRTLPGLIVIIYLPALAIVIEELRRLTKYYKSQQPYIASGFTPHIPPARFVPAKVAMGATVLITGISLAIAVPAHALLRSNTVSLAPNRISVAVVTPPNNCSGNTTNNTNVNVTNTSNQTATTGNASNTNNTTGGSATSGNASNTNNANVNINVNNCH